MDKPTQLSQWMLGMRNDEPLTHKDPAARAQYRLLYQLYWQEQQWQITVGQARITWSGETGKTKQLDWNRIAAGHSPAAADAVDREQLPLLARVDGRLKHLPEHEADVLLQLARNQRLHFRAFDGPLIGIERRRHAELVWSVDARGNQRCLWHIAADKPVFLLADSNIYLDTATTTIGELAPLPLAAHTLPVGRWITPEELTPVRAVFERAGQPLPRKMSVETRATCTPIPKLSLDSEAAATHRGRHQHRADLAFSYAEAIAAAPSPDAVARYFDQQQVICIPRDPVHEQTLLDDFDRISWRTRSLRHGPRATLPSDNDWLDFMLLDVPQLRAAGWQVESSTRFQFRLAEAEDFYGEVEDVKGGNDWFSFHLGALIDGERVNLIPLISEQIEQLQLDLTSHVREDLLVKLADGRQLPIKRELISRIITTLLEVYQRGSNNEDGLRLKTRQLNHLIGLDSLITIDWRDGRAWRDLVMQLSRQTPLDPVAVSPDFKAVLRDYQHQGFEWLHKLFRERLGGLLADDMGLGKTVQTLALISRLKADGELNHPVLVLAPTSLLYNWQMETRQFAPTLSSIVIHGNQREALWRQVDDHDMLITSYPLVRRDQRHLKGREFDLVILDEAQMLKNPQTKTTQLVSQLQRRCTIGLSGTPLENHLGELWTLFQLVMPDFLGRAATFNRLYRRPIEQSDDMERRQMLSQRVLPFLLRRKKQDVALELPPKTEIDQTVNLYEDQQTLYETIRLAMHQRVRDAIRRQGLERSQLVILDALLKLRQLCCHPRLVKLQSAQTLHASAKLDMLMEMLPEMIEEGRRILLFSQFTQMLAIIEKTLKNAGIAFVTLTGSTRDRQSVINHFQSGMVPVFLISLKAGGTGLNLTAADTVIHYDPWWNPAVENQATDRAHRIGQEKAVFVYRLICQNSVEEKIQALQKKKQKLYQAILDGDRQTKLGFSINDVDSLFAPLT